jgi:hypothetical protein
MILSTLFLKVSACVPGNPSKAAPYFRGICRPSPRRTRNASPVAFGTSPRRSGGIPRMTFTDFAVHKFRGIGLFPLARKLK